MIWPIEVPLKAVAADASGVLMSLSPICSEIGSREVHLVLYITLWFKLVRLCVSVSLSLAKDQLFSLEQSLTSSVALGLRPLST